MRFESRKYFTYRICGTKKVIGQTAIHFASVMVGSGSNFDELRKNKQVAPYYFHFSFFYFPSLFRFFIPMSKKILE